MILKRTNAATFVINNWLNIRLYWIFPRTSFQPKQNQKWIQKVSHLNCDSINPGLDIQRPMDTKKVWRLETSLNLDYVSTFLSEAPEKARFGHLHNTIPLEMNEFLQFLLLFLVKSLRKVTHFLQKQSCHHIRSITAVHPGTQYEVGYELH